MALILGIATSYERHWSAALPAKSEPEAVRKTKIDQPLDRTSLPGRAPVSSPLSKMAVPEQIVMS